MNVIRESSRSISAGLSDATSLRGVALVLVALAMLWAGTPPAWALLGDYQAAVTNEPSLISYYTFDLGNATDSHGTNNGTLMDTTAFAAGPGGSGQALVLNGTGRVNLGAVDDFVFADDDTGSVEAWVKAGTLSANACIVANRDGQSRYSIHMNSDKGGIGMWNGGAYFPTVAIPNASTNWHHMVVVFADGFYTVYWDGVLAGQQSRPLGFTDSTKQTQIGSSSPFGNSEGWVGMLDEVAFYSDALTPEAVQAHYNAFLSGAAPVISQQPQGGVFLPGVALTLKVQATGVSLTYQWRKNSAALPGKTDSTLSFGSLAAGDAGNYDVIVTSFATSVTSSNAVVALGSLPAALANYQTAVSNEAGLISYYTFDHLTAEDVIGANDGALAGTAGWATGIGGGAAKGLLLDGAGHVNLGTVPDFDFPSGNGTVEAWFRADWSASGYSPCFAADRNGGPTVWSLHLSGAKTTLAFYNGSGSALFPTPAAGTNWHHLAAVFTNGTASFYVDGTLAQFSPLSRPLGTGPGTVQIGSSASSTSEGWIGMLDEVAFYSNALSASAIQAHYNAFVGGNPPAITTQPVGGYYLSGQLVQLSVAASGAQLQYQWYKDNAAIPDATNAFLGPVTATPALSGSYYVTVTNPSGSTNSAVAIVLAGNDIARYQTTISAESSLISYYTFDGGDPSDTRGAHPGTVANTVAYGSGPGGVTNLSLVLDGTGHIDLGQVPEFDFTDGSGTVEGWIRPDWVNPAPHDPCPFADRDVGSVWSVHVDRWKTLILNYSSGAQSIGIAANGDWHHYAIVFNAGTVTMYWDGKFRGSFNQTINSFLARTTQIGSSAPLITSEGWLGGIDEVAFYSAALGPDAIWNHYLAMVGPPSLSYSLAAGQLTLSWPGDATGYVLESTDNLSGGVWTSVNGVVNNQVTVNASTGNKFFRLKR